VSIIGFDISTKCVGVCVLNDDGSFSFLDYIWLEREKDEYKRIDLFEEGVRNSCGILTAPRIFVEAPLMRSNNQNVVNILQRHNGMCCLCLYRMFGMNPELIAETDVRKLNNIKVPKGVKGIDKKKYVLKYVQDLALIPESRWELKKTGNPRDQSFDMADAFCVARAGFRLG
jgi:hypothetical protein